MSLAMAFGGAGLLVVFAAQLGWDLVRQAQLNKRLRDEPGSVAATASGTPRTTPEGIPFALDIPKLGYFGAVREGVDEAVLEVGPGHYPGTAWPGQSGNVAVAAHNVYWLRFDQLATGDQVFVRARGARYMYRVGQVRVVDPNDRTVLAPTSARRLTLTTCWPLWAGSLAGRRLAISADLAGQPRAVA